MQVEQHQNLFSVSQTDGGKFVAQSADNAPVKFSFESDDIAKAVSRAMETLGVSGFQIGPKSEEQHKARDLLVRLKGSDEEKLKLKREMERKLETLRMEMASVGLTLTGSIE